MNTKLLTPYLTFLKQEIPSILHILIFFEILGLVLSNHFLKLFLIILSAVLTYWYIEEKGKLFLIHQIQDRFSTLNLQHLSDENLAEKWKEYTLLTAVFIGVVLAALTYNFSLR